MPASYEKSINQALTERPNKRKITPLAKSKRGRSGRKGNGAGKRRSAKKARLSKVAKASDDDDNGNCIDYFQHPEAEEAEMETILNDKVIMNYI